MKIFKLLALLIVFNILLFAEIFKSKFQHSIFTNDSGNSFDALIELHYKMIINDNIPVIKLKVKYSIDQTINVGGVSYYTSKLPKKVIDTLRLYNLKIPTKFDTSNNFSEYLYVDIDLETLGKPNEWTFHTIKKESYENWIYYNKPNNIYLSKDDALKAYKGFKRLGVKSNLLSEVYTKKVKFDITGLKKYLNKKSNKK